MTKLIVAASETCADLLYLSGFRAPDAFAFIEHRGRKILLLSELEIDRACRTACVDEVCALRDFMPKSSTSYASALARFLASLKIRTVTVPPYFSLKLAKDLEHSGVRVRTGEVCPEREIKSSREIALISAACRLAEIGIQRAWEILRASRICRHRHLAWAGKPLTAEILRSEIETSIVRAGGEARGDTIVACGEAACDPHERGTGVLRAHELIVLDVFPRSASSGYFGDITRTVIRGHASDAQRKLWEVCLAGQRHALKLLRLGAKGKDIQNAVHEKFVASGFPKEQHEGRWRGFFHGLGHGLGLEVHEAPRVGTTTIAPGQVITIEPGIYWPGVGGVRHEDVVAITPTSYRLLTHLPKPLEI